MFTFRNSILEVYRTNHVLTYPFNFCITIASAVIALLTLMRGLLLWKKHPITPRMEAILGGAGIFAWLGAAIAWHNDHVVLVNHAVTVFCLANSVLCGIITYLFGFNKDIRALFTAQNNRTQALNTTPKRKSTER